MTILTNYSNGFKETGKIAKDVPHFLARFKHQKTASHCADVAHEASTLAKRFGCNPHQAELAGYLHDISAVVPNEKRIAFARNQRVDVLVEEVECPMIIHQKLSVVFARELFNVTDTHVLSAIGCHTTLKAHATLLDNVVFLADKIAWDQEGQPPCIEALNAALAVSLEDAVMVYLNYLWVQRNQLQVIHPWFLEAREYMLL